MKIVFISQYFFPEQFSNNAIVRDLSENRGHDVHVITGVPNYPAGEFFPGYSNTDSRESLFCGAVVSRSWTVARGQSVFQLLLNYAIFPVTGTWTMLRKIRERPDVSLVSMPSPLSQAFVGIFLKWRHKTPVAYWVQDIWPESALYTLKLTNPLIVYPLRWLCGWIYRRADLILVQSTAFPKIIERFGVAPEKIRVFPNTAPEKYRPLPSVTNSEIGQMMPNSGFNLMFAGNVGESQDFDTFIAAAELLRGRKDLNWVIVGSGRDMSRVIAKVDDLGLNDKFYFLGRHPEDQMPEFFSHADAMLVGLKSNPIFQLTVPYKIQCYMACGKPIIASLDGEGARIVNEAGCGLTIPASKPEELASQVLAMLELPKEEIEKMGRNSLDYFVDNYSASIVFGNLNTWLEELAGTNN